VLVLLVHLRGFPHCFSRDGLAWRRRAFQPPTVASAVPMTRAEVIAPARGSSVPNRCATPPDADSPAGCHSSHARRKKSSPVWGGAPTFIGSTRAMPRRTSGAPTHLVCQRARLECAGPTARKCERMESSCAFRHAAPLGRGIGQLPDQRADWPAQAVLSERQPSPAAGPVPRVGGQLHRPRRHVAACRNAQLDSIAPTTGVRAAALSRRAGWQTKMCWRAEVRTRHRPRCLAMERWAPPQNRR